MAQALVRFSTSATRLYTHVSSEPDLGKRVSTISLGVKKIKALSDSGRIALVVTGHFNAFLATMWQKVLTVFACLGVSTFLPSGSTLLRISRMATAAAKFCLSINFCMISSQTNLMVAGVSVEAVGIIFFQG